MTESGHQNGPSRIHRRDRLSAAALLMKEDMPKASSKSLGVFVPSAGAALSQTDAFFMLWLRGVTQNLNTLFPASRKT
jgi:hypothetical protein